MGRGLKKFGKEIKAEGPIRIVRVSNVPDNHRPPFYQPFLLAHHYAFSAPKRWLARKIFGPSTDFSLWLALPPSVLVGYGIFYGYNEGAGAVIVEAGEEGIEDHAAYWNDTLENEYEHDEFRRLRDSKNPDTQITPVEARKRAFNLKHGLDRYYEHMQANPEQMHTIPEAFVDNVLFEDIKKVETFGVEVGKEIPRAPGFKVALTSTQIATLAQYKHNLYAYYHLIRAWVEKSPALDMLLKDPKNRSIIANFEKDPHVKKLVNAGLPKRKLIYYLKRDADWRFKFLRWDLIRVEKLQKEAGEYTEEALTLQHIQNETLDDLGIRHTETDGVTPPPPAKSEDLASSIRP